MRLFRRLDDDVIEEIDRDNAKHFSMHMYNQVPEEETHEESGALVIDVEDVERFYLIDGDGASHPVRQLLVLITYRTETVLKSFKFYRYREDDGRLLSEAAVAETDGFGDLKGRMMLIRDEDQMVRVQFMDEGEGPVGLKVV